MFVQLYKNHSIYKCTSKGKYYILVDNNKVGCSDSFGELVNKINTGTLYGEPVQDEPTSQAEEVTKVVRKINKKAKNE
jgi:hypothetical protein